MNENDTAQGKDGTNGYTQGHQSEAIQRQTQAIEQIRDHYYPPPPGRWRRSFGFCAKWFGIAMASIGVYQTLEWVWNIHESKTRAASYAKVAHRLFFDEGNAAGAVQCYEKAVELDKSDSDYLTALTFMRGMDLASKLISAKRPLTDDERTRLDMAMADATMMLESEPGNAMPHILLAQAMCLKGDHKDAVDELAKAIRCDPKNVFVRTSSCAMYSVIGMIDESKRQLAQAEALDPEFPLTVCWKGIHSLSLEHDATMAAKHFKTMTKRNPRLALGHAYLGMALLAGEKPDIKDARESFRVALALEANQSMALVGMAETYEREGNYLVSRLWLDRAIDQDGNGVSALVARARVNGKLGDNEAAIADLTSALKISAFDADLYRQRAGYLEKAGKAAEAQSDRAVAAALGQ